MKMLENGIDFYFMVRNIKTYNGQNTNVILKKCDNLHILPYFQITDYGYILEKDKFAELTAGISI